MFDQQARFRLHGRPRGGLVRNEDCNRFGRVIAEPAAAAALAGCGAATEVVATGGGKQ